MRKGMIVLITCALILGMFGAPVQAVDAPASPAAIIEAVYAAVEAQDLDTAGALLADDVVLVLIPPPPGTNGTFIGKDAVLDWYANLNRNNFAIELSNVEESGNRVTLTNLTWVDDLPIAPVEFDGTGIVQNGLVKTLSWTITPATMAQLAAAMENVAIQDVIRRYLGELWSEGNLDIVDELIAENFVSHTFPSGEGREFMREMVTGFREEFPGVTLRLDEAVVSGNRVFVIATRLGPDGTPTGAPDLGIEDMLVFDLKDGQITDRWYFVPPPE